MAKQKSKFIENIGTANGLATLDSGGKVPVAQLPASVMTYNGTWNATTNSPTLADGTGDAGDIYIVSVAGAQNLGSGSIDFIAGDWVIYNGTIWQKTVNSAAVASVNGLSGDVEITTDEVSEGVTNIWFTNTRAKSAAVADSITNGVTDVAPSQNAVFDALALKAPSTTPTVQVLTSGTGATYTTPANCRYIKIRMVGGGGGGGGTGSASAGNGTAGGNTTFGSLTAYGGSGGPNGTNGGFLGGAGGGASGGDLNFTGSPGLSASGNDSLNQYQMYGHIGGNSVFGGAGGAGTNGGGNTGGSAQSNSGSGGGSAGGGSNNDAAGSGGAGGYLEKMITSPSSTYTYTVGSGGAGGTAGTNGGTGGAGGSGIIIVEEFY
jgi:hypothetical protein